MGHAAFGKTRQVLSRKAIVQQRHGLVGGGQRRLHVSAFKDQRIVRRAEHQRRMESVFVGLQISRLIALQQHFDWMQRAPAQPAAQGKRTGQRCFGALPGGRQVIAVHRQNQCVTFIQQTKTQVSAFGDDSLIAHQPLKAFDQGITGHQRVTGDMKRGRAHHFAHVQTDGRIAGHLHRPLPEPGHGVLRETRIRIIQSRVIQPQLLEQNPAIQAVHLQRFDNPHRPACRSRSFAHGVFLLHGGSPVAARFAKDTKVAPIVTGPPP